MSSRRDRCETHTRTAARLFQSGLRQPRSLQRGGLYQIRPSPPGPQRNQWARRNGNVQPPLAERGIHLGWRIGCYRCQDLSVPRSTVWESTHRAYVGCSRDQNATHMAVTDFNHRTGFNRSLYQWQMHQQGLSSARGVIDRRRVRRRWFSYLRRGACWMWIFQVDKQVDDK